MTRWEKDIIPEDFEAELRAEGEHPSVLFRNPRVFDYHYLNGLRQINRNAVLVIGSAIPPDNYDLHVLIMRQLKFIGRLEVF